MDEQTNNLRMNVLCLCCGEQAEMGGVARRSGRSWSGATLEIELVGR